MESKTFALAEVRDVETESPNGEFEVILSAPTLDRDGEIVDAKAFEPLPDTIPMHAFHDFTDPVARAAPFYAEDGTLHARGFYGSTARAQEIRTLVAEGIIGHTSVGFMKPERTDSDEEPHITKGELLEGSFVSVPSNRDAAVVMAKSFGDGTKASKGDRLQQIHDLAVQNGATCESKLHTDVTTTAPVAPADEAGKSPASTVVEAARIRAQAALLSIR